MNFMMPSDLIWLQTGFIGDVVLTTAAIELAAQKFPGLRQHLLTTAIGAQAIGDHPALQSCTVFSKSIREFPRIKALLQGEIANPQTTVVLQAHRSFRSSFLARYLAYPTITYDESSAAWLAKICVPRVAVLHEAQRIALLLEPLGIERADIVRARPRLIPLALDQMSDWQRQIAQSSERLIGLAPGSVWGTKRWPVESFAALAEHLLADPKLAVVLIGSKAEEELGAAICQKLAGKASRVFNLIGKTSLSDLRRVLPRLSLMIANDSSPLHFASALAVPTVALFGATTAAMGFAPLAPQQRTLEVSGLACRPCSAHGPAVCPLNHFRCMRDLSVNMVVSACEELLASSVGAVVAS